MFRHLSDLQGKIAILHDKVSSFHEGLQKIKEGDYDNNQLMNADETSLV